ncbi:hypothetical protein GPECTOR_12g589 [Gonium pectorale]|uniref:Uncharacterized protein n=1 Tax=Gonium pectorale TaxID=33097 RepID=A0A150GPA7_GONPE|nr:hypothetical protein GPECTOR_12g589 [Gonium pectorale]|eukprot:KXZ51625.1 hypothetical protein GPECTOR_12g589 [Gonium pectorale]
MTKRPPTVRSALRRFADDLPREFKDVLGDLQEDVSNITSEVEVLETFTVDAISFQELVGHCLALYQANRGTIKLLEDHLHQYGFQPPPGMVHEPEDPLAAASAVAAKQPTPDLEDGSDDDRDAEELPTCRNAMASSIRASARKAPRPSVDSHGSTTPDGMLYSPSMAQLLAKYNPPSDADRALFGLSASASKAGGGMPATGDSTPDSEDLAAAMKGFTPFARREAVEPGAELAAPAPGAPACGARGIPPVGLRPPGPPPAPAEDDTCKLYKELIRSHEMPGSLHHQRPRPQAQPQPDAPARQDFARGQDQLQQVLRQVPALKLASPAGPQQRTHPAPAQLPPRAATARAPASSSGTGFGSPGLLDVTPPPTSSGPTRSVTPLSARSVPRNEWQQHDKLLAEKMAGLEQAWIASGQAALSPLRRSWGGSAGGAGGGDLRAAVAAVAAAEAAAPAAAARLQQNSRVAAEAAAAVALMANAAPACTLGRDSPVAGAAQPGRGFAPVPGTTPGRVTRAMAAAAAATAALAPPLAAAASKPVRATPLRMSVGGSLDCIAAAAAAAASNEPPAAVTPGRAGRIPTFNPAPAVGTPSVAPAAAAGNGPIRTPGRIRSERPGPATFVPPPAVAAPGAGGAPRVPQLRIQTSDMRDGTWGSAGGSDEGGDWQGFPLSRRGTDTIASAAAAASAGSTSPDDVILAMPPLSSQPPTPRALTPGRGDGAVPTGAPVLATSVAMLLPGFSPNSSQLVSKALGEDFMERHLRSQQSAAGTSRIPVQATAPASAKARTTSQLPIGIGPSHTDAGRAPSADVTTAATAGAAAAAVASGAAAPLPSDLQPCSEAEWRSLPARTQQSFPLEALNGHLRAIADIAHGRSFSAEDLGCLQLSLTSTKLLLNALVKLGRCEVTAGAGGMVYRLAA